MMNAPAPMIGGINCPPVEADASTPAANLALNPFAFINGIVMTPVDAVLATAEPEIVPVNAEDITATNAAPPRSLPAILLDISMTKSEAPDTTRKAPKIINKVIFAEEMVVMIPNMPSSLYSDRKSTSSSGRLAALKAPGIISPRKRL